MERIMIPHQLGSLAHRHPGGTEKLTGFIDPVLDQKVLGAFLCGFFEHLAEVAAVQSQVLSHILHGDLFHIMIFDKIHRRLDIEILDVILGKPPGIPGIADEGAEE